MRITDGRLLATPTDLVGFAACDHLAAQELEAARGAIGRPERQDPTLDLLARTGEAHERAYLDDLAARGIAVTCIEDPDGAGGAAGTAALSGPRLREAAARTAEAVARGDAALFQATFVDESGPVTWVGKADFLLRVDDPTRGHAGAPRYEPVDAKLARQVTAGAALQLACYAELLELLQGSPPERVHVLLGDGQRAAIRLRDVDAAYRQIKRRFEEAVTGGLGATYPEPVGHCAVCRWLEVCAARRTDDDHLSLVPHLSVEQARKLAGYAGITTVAELAAAPDDLSVPGIGDEPLARLRRQARVQVRSREAGRVVYELAEPTGEADHGLARLPEPSPGDLFLDLEGDPFYDADGLEYLFGLGWVDADGSFGFRAFWAHDRDEERTAFEALVDEVEARRAAHPDLCVYHYAPYERTALGTLAGRHATREATIDRWLRAGLLVDLYPVVRQGLVVGADSYSLKALEPLYLEGAQARTGEIGVAADSIVEYERWRHTADPAILDRLEHYNREDVRSTWQLREWLEARRAEAEARFGWALPRPQPGDGEPSEATAEADEATAALAAALVGAASSADAGWRGLLAHLLDWHRREDRPAWWRYFHRLDLADDPLALDDDPECVAGLTYEGVVEQVKQSLVHRYRHDPDSEHKFTVSETVLDPHTERDNQHLAEGEQPVAGPGTVHDIDHAAGTIDLRRRASSTAAHPRALIPQPTIDNRVLREALRRVAGEVIAGSGRYAAAEALLRRELPRLAGHAGGAALYSPGADDAADAAVGLAPRLDASVLTIQGPPGSGKTYTGARIVGDLVARGRTVGVCAHSHLAITKLLDEVAEQAAAAGQTVRILQRGPEDKTSTRSDVTRAGANPDVANALDDGEVDVVGGTPWLFSRAELDGSFDHLVIDEAGQLSLANTVAVATAAASLLLIGDPQQLAQPSQGTHPPGAGVSALAHLLGEHATVPPERGVFLDRTRRLHPELCTYVSATSYDDRLSPIDGLERQRIDRTHPALEGAGLRWMAVDHHGDRTSSWTEAREVAATYQWLRDGGFTDADGARRQLTADDILVVAPYNAHVARLRAHLGPQARVGTVDRFQGQQAPVVIVSLATSDPAHAPRGMEFLYDPNRLNVAVSRAQALAVVVASPRLLDADCRTLRHLTLLNGLCRLTEHAATLPRLDDLVASGALTESR